ncbi:MAG: cellulase family glycosylhydrolase [Verrucomicrobia bacterium]|nr:cellulase family glycosylhydrolase [Verrucomicrobiota bacterium]
MKIPVDIVPLRGAEVIMTCIIKAQDVTQPADSFNGFKIMLTCDSATKGALYKNPSNVYGTFDWQEFSIMAAIPRDASNGQLSIGFQGCGGTAWLEDVRITIVHPAPVRPAIDPQAPPLVRNHVPMRGVTTPPIYRVKDFPDLATWKVNVARWMMAPGKDAKTMSVIDYDAWLESAFLKLDQALADARANSQKLVIDLHGPPGGRDADGNLRMLFDESLGNQFVRVWAKIAARYKGNDAVFAYGIVNEPVQTGYVPEGLPDWLELQSKAAYVVRHIDPDTPILIASDGFDSPESFDWMPLLDIPKVIYEAHMYYPHSFTHQGVKKPLGGVGGDPIVTYPGTMNGSASGPSLNKDVLRAFLQPVRDFQRSYRAQIYIGEFSAVRWAPGAAQYLQDVTDILEEYGWDWSYHAFREAEGWDLECENLPYDLKLGVQAKTPPTACRSCAPPSVKIRVRIKSRTRYNGQMCRRFRCSANSLQHNI